MLDFKNLGKNMKVALLVYLISLLGFLASIFAFFFGRMDVPLGILLGGVVIGSLHLLSDKAENKDANLGGIKYTLIMLIVRLSLIVAVSVIIALMYFRWDLKIFNIIAFIGVYTVSVIFTVTINLIDKR